MMLDKVKLSIVLSINDSESEATTSQPTSLETGEIRNQEHTKFAGGYEMR